MAKEVLYERKSNSGTVRLTRDSKGNVKLDSYFGNVKDKDDHDRFSLNTTTGRGSGHGFNHENKFDTAKADTKGYDSKGNKIK